MALVLLATTWLGMLCIAPPPAHAQTPSSEAPDPATVAVWRTRWGHFVDMLGVPYVTADLGVGGRPTIEMVQTATWKVPGEVMLFTTTGQYPSQSTLRWDEAGHRLVNDANRSSSVQTDGSIVTTYPVGDEIYRSTSRMREDRSVEYVTEKQQGGAWLFFNRIVQVPSEKLAAYQADNPIPSLDAWVGKQLVSPEGGRIIQLQRGSNGPWSLDVFLPNGQIEGRFEMGAAKKKLIDSVAPYELTQVALQTCDAELPTQEDAETLAMETGGVPVILFKWECGKRSTTGFKGTRMFEYSVRPTSGGLQVDYKQVFLSKKYESTIEWDRRLLFVAVTDELLAKAAEAYAREQEQVRLALEAKREERRERDAKWSRTMGAVSAALGAANEVAAASEAESRAALDATLAEAAGRARVGSSTEMSTPAQASPVDRPQPSATSLAKNTAAAPGEPLRFVLDIGLQPRAGDRVNPTCYSTVITRPGPAGWGQRGSLPAGSSRSAQDTVQSFKSRFIAACKAASGRDTTSEGNFHWTWNETGDDQQVSNVRARANEDVTVDID